MFKNLGRHLNESRWIILFGITIFLGRMFEADFHGDGMHYAAISKGLLEKENILTLGFHDYVYMNKPPLFFWLNALMMKALGVIPFAAILVSGACGVGIMVLLYFMTLRFWANKNIAHLTAFVFATNYIVYRNTITCRLESLLALVVLAGVYMILLYMDQPRRKYAAFFGFFCGLAVLTKGAAGLLPFFSGAGFLIWWLAGRRQWRRLADVALALAVFTVSFGWWYAYSFITTEFFRQFIMNESVNRIGSNGFEWEPIWLYGQYLAVFYFYYLPFAVYGVYKAVKSGRLRSELILLAVVVVPWLISIHFLATKYYRYLYVFIMLLSPFTAYGLYRLWRIPAEKWLARVTIVFMLFLILYPFNLNRDEYRFLSTVQHMADRSRMDIVVDRNAYGHWATKSGVYFFLDDFKFESDGERYFYVTDRDVPRPDASRLFKSRQVRVYLVGQQ